MTDSGRDKEGAAPPPQTLRTVAEDAVGFGAAELRMARDLVVRPRHVARMQTDPGSPYPRPIRFLLTLTGLFLGVMALLGGYQSEFRSLPPAALEPLQRLSGKSPDALAADLDQWFAFVVTPIVTLALFLPLRALIRRWCGRDGAGDRALVFLSGWTLYGAPITLTSAVIPALRPYTAWLGLLILVVLFVRIGWEDWWRGPGQAVGRFVQMTLLMGLAYVPAVLVVAVVSALGAAFGP